mmetsp:Transcript_11173/g.21031  ORF Transcript_11173/g.21031 Transcript_11173/m.21031 type:complete len:224 (-) Transcript_11173:1096-1767(-)
MGGISWYAFHLSKSLTSQKYTCPIANSCRCNLQQQRQRRRRKFFEMGSTKRQGQEASKSSRLVRLAHRHRSQQRSPLSQRFILRERRRIQKWSTRHSIDQVAHRHGDIRRTLETITQYRRDGIRRSERIVIVGMGRARYVETRSRTHGRTGVLGAAIPSRRRQYRPEGCQGDQEYSGKGEGCIGKRFFGEGGARIERRSRERRGGRRPRRRTSMGRRVPPSFR